MEHCAVIEIINIPLQITQHKNHSNAKYYHKQVAKCRIGWGAKHRLCAGAKCRGAKMTDVYMYTRRQKKRENFVVVFDTVNTGVCFSYFKGPFLMLSAPCMILNYVCMYVCVCMCVCV